MLPYKKIGSSIFYSKTVSVPARGDHSPGSPRWGVSLLESCGGYFFSGCFLLESWDYFSGLKVVTRCDVRLVEGGLR